MLPCVVQASVILCPTLAEAWLEYITLNFLCFYLSYNPKTWEAKGGGYCIPVPTT